MGSLLLGIGVIAIILMLAVKSAFPWRIIGRLARNMLLALIVLCLLGAVGQMFSFHLPINLPAVLLLAILGLPGLGLLVVLNFLLV